MKTTIEKKNEKAYKENQAHEKTKTPGSNYVTKSI